FFVFCIHTVGVSSWNALTSRHASYATGTPWISLAPIEVENSDWRHGRFRVRERQIAYWIQCGSIADHRQAPPRCLFGDDDRTFEEFARPWRRGRSLRRPSDQHRVLAGARATDRGPQGRFDLGRRSGAAWRRPSRL